MEGLTAEDIAKTSQSKRGDSKPHKQMVIVVFSGVPGVPRAVSAERCLLSSSAQRESQREESSGDPAQQTG